MMEQIIRGERIKQVRELIGYNQTELAQKLEVTQAAIALMESGRIMPTDNILNQLSFLTGFPVSFFKQEPIIDVPLGSLLFRGKRSVTVRERNQLYRYAQTLCELTNSLFRHIKPIPVKIPKLPNEEPSEAAKLTRSLLGLSPDKPIEHLTSTIEKAGAVILSIPQSSEIDAFSFWIGSTPVIAITDGWSGERIRLSLAHELGHLVLHGAGYYNNHSDLESDAFSFAGEFMVPESSLREELNPPIKLSDYGILKARWGVSIQHLILRSERLNIITKRQYKYLFQQVGKNGWRKKEPIEIPIEKPRLLRQLAEMIYGIPVNVKTVAFDNHIAHQIVEDTLYRYLGKSERGEVGNKRGQVFSFPSSK